MRLGDNCFVPKAKGFINQKQLLKIGVYMKNLSYLLIVILVIGLSFNVVADESFSISVYTDKNTYYPGEVVKISSYLTWDGIGSPGQTIVVNLCNPDNKVVDTDDTITNAAGYYEDTCITGTRWKRGPHTVRNILYVGGIEPNNYTKIQDAIDDATDGDTVFVYNGTYAENININKDLTLTDTRSASTTIQAGADGTGENDGTIESTLVFDYSEQPGISNPAAIKILKGDNAQDDSWIVAPGTQTHDDAAGTTAIIENTEFGEYAVGGNNEGSLSGFPRYITDGCILHPISFNHPNLTQLTWTAEIYEYDYIPSGDNPFRIRIEFNSVGFMGNGADYPYCYVGAMIQNLEHHFENDIVGSQFTDPPTIMRFPALGLYLSSLHSDWDDNYHGVELLADPDTYPQFGRVFEDVDGYGHIGKNIYTRENVGNVSLENPIRVKWTITKGETVTNPLGNYSKNIDGDWIPLIGTFVKWNFKIVINETLYNVADYYLPIEKAEYIWAWDPLVLHQEYFGAGEGILDAQKGHVRYTNMRAYDGTDWYNLDDWKITWRITSNGTDNRFGWKADDNSLYSRVGHEEDITECYRNVGQEFHITLPPPSEVWVDDDYTEGSCSSHTWNYGAFDKIQDGVNAVATNGTVYVFNGTYHENVIINKSLTLQNSSKPVIEVSGIAVEIDANNVNFTGFTVQNADTGILVKSGISNAAIHNNSIVNNTVYGVNGTDAATIVNATHNWWGSITGPYHPTVNENGTGDNVSDNVTFNPWLGEHGGIIYQDETQTNTTGGIGNETIDAMDIADTMINISTNVSTNITISNYTTAPGGDMPGGIGALGKYIDIEIENESAVNWPINITLYYTQGDLYDAGMNESDLMGLYFWNETSDVWELYEETGVNTTNVTIGVKDYAGYVWAIAHHLTPMQPGKGMTKNYSLLTGWNLVSIPVILDNTTTSSVLSSLAGNHGLVWAFDPTLGWRWYDPGDPDHSTLYNIDGKIGFWIYMTASDTLNNTGKPPTTTDISLSAGWNLIGYPSYTANDTSNVLSSIAGNHALVWRYNRSYTPYYWECYDPGTELGFSEMEPGYGYWIWMIHESTLEVKGKW